jgi:hypothetical protein
MRRIGVQKAASLGVLAAVIIAVVVTAAVLWENHAKQSVSFRGRDYINRTVISDAQATKFKPLTDVHARLRGLEVMVPTLQLHGGLSPTVILLRRGDGRYDIYALSGGP